MGCSNAEATKGEEEEKEREERGGLGLTTGEFKQKHKNFLLGKQV